VHMVYAWCTCTAGLVVQAYISGQGTEGVLEWRSVGEPAFRSVAEGLGTEAVGCRVALG